MKVIKNLKLISFLLFWCVVCICCEKSKAQTIEHNMLLTPLKNAYGQNMVKKIKLYTDEGIQTFTFDYEGALFIRATMMYENDIYALGKTDDGMGYTYANQRGSCHYSFETENRQFSKFESPMIPFVDNYYDSYTDVITYKYRTEGGITYPYLLQYRRNLYLNNNLSTYDSIEQGFLNNGGEVQVSSWSEGKKGKGYSLNNECNYQPCYKSSYKDNTNINLIVFVLFRKLADYSFPLLTSWVNLNSSYLPDYIEDAKKGNIVDKFTYTWLDKDIVSTISVNGEKFLEVTYYTLWDVPT